MWWAIFALAALWLLIYLVPDLLFHHLQWGAFAGSRVSAQVAITFDDGPGPDTPAVLDKLQQLGVKATFFLISERAQAAPEIARRIVNEGHAIGLHMSRHVSAFALSPWQSYRQVRRGLDELEALTGLRPIWFRPPWGHINLGTWLAIVRFRLTPALWNIAPDDWRPDRSASDISRFVVQLAQPGVVVVLHDAGGPRQRTVDALQDMVEGLKVLGLEPVALPDIQRDRSLLRRIWTWWEIRFTRGWNIESVPNRQGGQPILRIGHIRYRGDPVVLAAGSQLRRGDPLGEIHFGNPALSQFSGRSGSGLRALHGVMTALGDVAAWLKTHPEYGDIVALGGVTLLDAARTVEKLGFQHVPVRGWTKWSMWIYLIVLMSIYHSDGWRTLRRFRRLQPVMLVMDIQILWERYGTERESRRKKK